MAGEVVHIVCILDSKSPMTMSIFETLRTAARSVGAKCAFARSSLQRHSIWLIAIAYAILAFSWNQSFFSDTWWLVYVPGMGGGDATEDEQH